MKQTLNFAAWWRQFSGQSIKIAFSTTKMAPPGGEIKFVFHRSKSTFPALSHAQKIHIFILVVSCIIFELT